MSEILKSFITEGCKPPTCVALPNFRHGPVPPPGGGGSGCGGGDGGLGDGEKGRPGGMGAGGSVGDGVQGDGGVTQRLQQHCQQFPRLGSLRPFQPAACPRAHCHQRLPHP